MSFDDNILLKYVIENFPACPLEYDCPLNSPLFLVRDSEIQFKLFPRGVSSECRKFTSCFIEMKKVGDVELDCLLDITDADDNSLARQEFQILPCEQKVEVGFPKLICTETVLNKIARSSSDAMIVKCHLKKVQSKAVAELLVARTLIGVNRCSFTWFLENLDSNFTMTKVMYFPECTKMRFNLINYQTYFEIWIFKWMDDSDNGDDDERDRDDDYGSDIEARERALVFKISFLTVDDEELFTHQDWMEFNYHDEDSELSFYTYEKELFGRSFNETDSLKCEISISCGTYLKHVNPKRLIKNRKKSLKKEIVVREDSEQ